MITKILIITVIVDVFFACSKKSPYDEGHLNELLGSESSKSIVKSNSKFAFDLFKKVSASQTESNFMISPLSLSMALDMTYNGSNGATKTAFDKVLNHNQPISEINQFNNNLIKKLSINNQGYIMEIANSIWIEKQFPVKDEFVKLNKDNYKAEVANLDFKDRASVDRINSWVSDKTRRKIPKIIEQIPDNAVIFLINALYFNANWKHKFDANRTKKEPFYKTPTEPLQVDMMKMSGKVDYTENELFSSIILPYKNDRFSMIILLPKADKSTDDIVNQLNSQNWDSWLKTYNSVEVSVSIPKFKLSYEKELKDDLTQMGLGVAFSSNADFSKMTDEPVQISRVLQKTFIDVNEKGTEAAAVTIVTGLSTSPGLGRELHFTADRPFIYLIKENVTGSICFMGKVAEPKYD